MEQKTNFYLQGLQDGMEFCKNASPEEIEMAKNYETTDEILKKMNLIQFSPPAHENLGFYFLDIIREEPLFRLPEEKNRDIPNSYFRQWESGWATGVRNFWKENKHLRSSVKE